jgi:predicted RNA binding protein YcfA (HicA-like mRNA interferase family)
VRPITGTELCRLLELNGWKLQPIAGSHHIYSKSGERKVLSIPVHGNRNLKPGRASRLARDANLKW